MLEPHITTDGTVAEDLHCFTDFLRRLLSETVEAKENKTNRPALSVLQEALQYHYENSDFLKSALMGVNGSGTPTKETRNFKPFLGVACAVCLVLAIAGTAFSGTLFSKKRIAELKTEDIQPEIISVWIPLDDSIDELQQQEMYQTLAQGFEQEHQGFGVQYQLV